MTTLATTPPDVRDGIYENVPDDEYRRWPRMNPSCLDWGDETMEHLRAAVNGELKLKTKALAFGIAGHVKLLEPGRFKGAYAVSGQCEAITGKGAQCSRWGQSRHAGKWYCGTSGHAPEGAPDPVSALSPDDAMAMDMAAKRLYAHPAIALLRQNGGCEVSIAWTDKRTGIKCKTRIDKWIPECRMPWDTAASPIILDLKYLAACDDTSISYTIQDCGYHRRAAMTQDGIEALTGLRPDYILVCLLKTPPYSIAVRQIGEDSIKAGRWEYRGLLSAWKHCLKTGVYPGYGDDIQEIDLPAKKLKEIAGQMTGDDNG